MSKVLYRFDIRYTKGIMYIQVCSYIVVRHIYIEYLWEEFVNIVWLYTYAIHHLTSFLNLYGKYARYFQDNDLPRPAPTIRLSRVMKILLDLYLLARYYRNKLGKINNNKITYFTALIPLYNFVKVMGGGTFFNKILFYDIVICFFEQLCEILKE